MNRNETMNDEDKTADDVREALPFVVSPKGGEWRHCSPELLSSGLNCGATLRQSCLCPGGGSHDHYVEVRPRGTVADAEVERAKTVLEDHLCGYVSEATVRAALEAAREDAS